MATSRPRGFIDSWNPQPHTIALVLEVTSIIEENQDIAPLTLRQIFYMLVSNSGYEKTEKAYKRLCETLNKARRARLVPMDAIRDDKLRHIAPHGWNSAEELVDTYKYSAREFRLHRQEGQELHIMVWCEAGGMLPQLVNYCEDFGVPVLSSGGFDSVTTKHNFAKDVCDYEAVEILHIGDHDPSGVHMCSSLDEDLTAFVDSYGGSVGVTRLAVTPYQVEDMGLPTSPPKSTDRRAFDGRTTQAEAIPPRRLKEIVQSAIVDRVDFEVREELLEREAEIRKHLTQKLQDI